MKLLQNKDFQKYAVSKGIGTNTLNKIQSSMTPFVISDSDKNLVMVDIYSKLMSDNIIFLGDVIDEYISNTICAQLLYLDSQTDDSVRIYIGSCPGGSVYGGNAILDTMDIIKKEISTTCIGYCASMASVILAHGNKGRREALKRSRIMIHQPLGGAYGQASDIDIENREIQLLKKELLQTLSDDTGVPFNRMKKICDRDYWMSAEESKKLGIIDSIV